MKNFIFKRSMVINYFKADTILLGGMGVKKMPSTLPLKLSNKYMINKILHV